MDPGMIDIKELLARLEEELGELQKQLESPEVDRERKKALSVLIKRFKSIRGGDRVLSLANAVFCGWALTPLTNRERNQLVSYRLSALTRLQNNGFDKNSMDLAMQLKEHFFDGGKNDNLPNLMKCFAEKVKEMIQQRDSELSDSINSIYNGVTCIQLLDEVEKKFIKQPTPHVEIAGQTFLQRKVYNTKKAAGKSEVEGVMRLRDWLNLDSTKVIEFMNIPGKSEKDHYLSDGFKKIMRSVTDKVRIVHRHGLIHGKLSIDSILVRHHDLDVRLTCDYKQGNPNKDFKSLKIIIESALVGHENDYPAELSHFLSNKSERSLMYIHPYLWTTYDFIYVVESIKTACDMDKDAIKEWIQDIPMASHEVFENKIDEFKFLKTFHTQRVNKYKRTAKKLQPLVFMRDANHHLLKSIKNSSDSGEYSVLRATRMAQLSCPYYVAQFMQVIVNKIRDGKMTESPVIEEMVNGYFKGGT